ncbi:helix-turn-helix domain-containing protein (plasmid) [Halomonas qinghailakensis]|uniref:Helix-turn-helix domain-containing protein n=1 Tax=Halomonas qinghailakensis TaxID=2937790 RepID=A0AA46YTF7_9GAMM|nr:helix-turn-helix domain-containing protein [Halomonas sp. ZZQ-149]UYO76372.1 helix-turn-helix domain-containing protein [Halomonas sp. ZZQ-149]
MQLTIPQVAKLYEKHRSTIHRHIESGRLSCGFRGDGTRVVDIAELVRCYGEPKQLPPEMQPDATAKSEDLQPAMLQALQAMHQELVSLREEVAQLRQLPPPPASTKPSALPQKTETYEDPHGLRSLARSMFENQANNKDR